MIAGLERHRSEGCASDLALDQLLLGELADDRRSELEQHLEECAHCRERLEVIKADRALFEQSAPAFSPMVESSPAQVAANDDAEGATVIPLLRRLAPVVGALAAAAALLLLVPKTPETGGPDVLAKGKSFLSFFVKHDGTVSAGARGQKVVPDDQLRFVVATAKDAYVAVLSVDGAGTLSVYYPEGGEHAASVKGAIEPVALPSATVLDDVLGKERIVGVLCDRATPLSELRAAVQSANKAGGKELALPAGCRADAFTLEKVAP